MNGKEWRTRVQDELNALEDLIDDCSVTQEEEFCNLLGQLFHKKGLAVDEVIIELLEADEETTDQDIADEADTLYEELEANQQSEIRKVIW